ncbi:hypothetical protein [Planococcus lenghuensis]|uniref:Uncharacterized protein n=1 Tax=Planococcus lenghuensis TaxID=2213202 RepID=A0A1Q2KY43_9BACL|nr:hypothetical protein [Planococcus lenghuensis]AQQ53121.1 hypothetical protein B0X71_08450 [Planococcus lenghuensis]
MRHFQWLLGLLIVTFHLAGCTAEEAVSAEEEQILTAFEEQGIELSISEHQSEAFDFPATDEMAYDFEGGSLLLFTGYEKQERIQEHIETNLAEMEFPYPVSLDYFNGFTVMVMVESAEPEIADRVGAAFRALEEM